MLFRSDELADPTGAGAHSALMGGTGGGCVPDGGLSAGPYAMDFEHWPLVVVRVVGRVSDDQHRSFIAQLDARVRQAREPYAMIMDLRGSGGITPVQRRRQAERVERLRDEGLPCAGVGLVLDSPLLRGMLTAVMWLARPAHEVRVFQQVSDARIWGETLLGQAA